MSDPVSKAPHDTEERAQARRCALIRAAVGRHSNNERPASGAFACPVCEDGEVFYVVRSDGLSRADCTNPHCASWRR